MAKVLPLRTAWIADILSHAPMLYVQRQRCWNRDCGDGQRLWDYGMTERSFNAVSALQFVRRRWKAPYAHASHLQDRRQPIAKSGKFVRAYSRPVLDCKKRTILCFLPSLNTPGPLFERGLGRGRRIWHCSRQWNTNAQLPKPQTATDSQYWANIEKRNKINTKKYWK